MARDRKQQQPGASDAQQRQEIAERGGKGRDQQQRQMGGAGDQAGSDPRSDGDGAGDYETTPVSDATGEMGRPISTWLEEGVGKTTDGTSTRSFSDVVESARRDAARSVEEQSLPSKYDETIREYFKELPTEGKAE